MERIPNNHTLLTLHTQTKFYSTMYIHTDKSLATPHYFGDTVLEVAERNMRVMEIKYFEVYCKFYYFDEHFELKMIL